MRQVNFTRKATKDENGLNKLEAKWLQEMQRRGYESIRVHGITLKLANDLRYTPDFSATIDGRFVIFETKGGFMREDSFIKLKTAARMWPEFDFVLVTLEKGAWIEKAVQP